jgi:integral membrane sensor domain MASE1
MDRLTTFVLVVGLTVLFMIFGPLIGALTGALVGLFFSTPILHVLSQAGLEGVTMWQLGATLGFVGGFFKAAVTGSDK